MRHKANLPVWASLGLLALLALPLHMHAQDLPEHLPELRFHLTAEPWEPLEVRSERYLDAIEGVCRVAARHQDERGAIIDPYLDREHQYSTPYFAFSVGTLLHGGRGEDLRDAGVAAMEHATASFAQGGAVSGGGIPDDHGEFFIAPLTKGLELYRDHVSEATYERWRERLTIPRVEVMGGGLANWRTYAMKGEWMRAEAGLVPEDTARAFIENAWKNQSQRRRIALDKWNLYQDWSSDPQSHAVEAVGRGNLTALLAEGYDGPSAEAMWRAVRRGTQTSLLLQGPDGQAPPNGRTDDHVFNDVLYQLLFDVMAEDAQGRGEERLAGQYRHAAMRSFNSIDRWRRTEAPWAGSYFITKNFFEPSERVGFQPASQWGNYNGAVMIHLAEAYLARQSEIEEQPSPTEIGGYALSTDTRFSSFAANAGGMQVFANLRGATVPKYDTYWTPLGVVRFGHVGWDGRLGPSDGKYDQYAGRKTPPGGRAPAAASEDGEMGAGVTFAPAWQEDGRWVRMADSLQHRRYRATPRVEFAHPLLVRFSLVYHDVTGHRGPYLQHEFTVTPDGVMTRLTSPDEAPFAVTIPLLENDGRPLQTDVSGRIARTAYEESGDEQTFISLNPEATMESGGRSIQSTYGWLAPVRVTTPSDTNAIFVYPRTSDDPQAEEVMQSFELSASGFSSSLGHVQGNRYVGRTSAGGKGDAIDLDRDGTPDVTFSASCQFVLQLRDGAVVTAEADRSVEMTYQGQSTRLEAYQPVDLEP